MSLSSLQREAACPASGLLADVDGLGGAVGNAIHAFLEVLVKEGQDAARGSAEAIADAWDLDERDRSIFYGRAWSFRPDIPRGALAEVALCLLESGEVVAVEGGRGKYKLPPGGLLAGTIDLLWSEPEPLIVDAQGRVRCPEGSAAAAADWKSGLERYVAPIETNLQVRAGALLAARWTGATRAIPMICFVEPGPGRWSAPDVALQPEDLAEIEGEVRGILARVEEQKQRRREGQPVELVTGPHCGFCPSRTQCPAHLSELRSLVTGAPSEVEQELSLAEEQKLVELLAPAKRMLARAEDYLREQVLRRGAPIPLGNGLVYGPSQEVRDRLDVRVTYEELAEVVGEELADRAFRISKAGLATAIEAHHEQQGVERQKAPAIRDLLRAIAARGGIKKETYETWHVHVPVAATQESVADLGGDGAQSLEEAPTLQASARAQPVDGALHGQMADPETGLRLVMDGGRAVTVLAASQLHVPLADVVGAPRLRLAAPRPLPGLSTPLAENLLPPGGPEDAVRPTGGQRGASAQAERSLLLPFSAPLSTPSATLPSSSAGDPQVVGKAAPLRLGGGAPRSAAPGPSRGLLPGAPLKLR